MSNCIDIVRGSHILQIPNNSIRRDDFKNMADRIREHKKNPGWDHPDSLGWWFLNGNVYFPDNCVEIRLGMGKSTHTWRDLKQTLNLINAFITKPFAHTFYITDEYDDFRAVGTMKIVLGKKQEIDI